MNRSLLATCVLAVCFSSCLENEEEITVRADGSVSVRMSSKGAAADLADGYPLPLAGPWLADSDATKTWIRALGPDTGSVGVRDNLSRSSEIKTDQELTLQVRADFTSANEIPRWIATESEPYRTAYLERDTRLRIENKSGRRVYTFERVFHAREVERFGSWFRVEQRMPKELKDKLDQRHDGGSVELTAREREQLIEIGTSTLIDASMPYAEDALLSVYTVGDASLDPKAVERVLQSVRESLTTVINRDCVATLVDMFLAGSEANESDDDEFEKLESDSRGSMRASLDAALTRDRVPLSTRNAVRGQLEWLFTAFDHSMDLGDESFSVTVHMPGDVVGGNFDKREDGRVSWELGGDRLADRDCVLRVVSVVD